MGPSLVSDMEISKMNEWPMKFAHPMLSNGAWHRAWAWMNEWVNSLSTTHPPLTLLTNILSQATAQLERRQKAQWKELLLLLFCFPPCCKISCDHLKPGSKIKGPWIQRTLITFQRVPLGFSYTIPVRGSGSLWFLCWALILGGINGAWLNHKCQEVWRAAQDAGHLHPGRGIVTDLPSPHWPWASDKGAEGVGTSFPLYSKVLLSCLGWTVIYTEWLIW